MSVKDFVEGRSLAVIILGSFNPAIIQPFWLAKKELIHEQEAQDTKVQLIHNELVDFDLGWARITVRPDRFEIVANSEPYFPLLKDLLVGIFFYLKETPITALGINYWYRLGLKNNDRFYDFGNKFAPLSNWDYLKNGRLVNLEILMREREDNIPGHYRLRIESDQVIPFGVSILINSHMDINKMTGNKTDIVSLINQYWIHTEKLAEQYFNQLWEKFNS